MAEPVANRFSRIPDWAVLSLAMNGLLFITLLVVWQSKSPESVLPQATAAELEELAQTPWEPQMGPIHRLKYQQWVDLLRQEVDAMTAKHPDQLTILLGDSISLWFPPELLPGRRVWLNQGISGEKTAGLLARLNLLDRAEVQTIFVMIGINDLIWGESPEQVVSNYRSILRYLRDTHPDTQIVVQSILPHGAEQATWESRDLLMALPNERVLAVNESLAVLADDYDAHYLDLYNLFATGEGHLRADLTTDGLHLNREGYLVWRAAIAMYSQLELQ